MGARQYDPVLGRFLSVDPLFEAFRNQGAYNYAFNSPVNWKDPSGLAPVDEKGNKLMSLAYIFSAEAAEDNLALNIEAYEHSKGFLTESWAYMHGIGPSMLAVDFNYDPMKNFGGSGSVGSFFSSIGNAIGSLFSSVGSKTARTGDDGKGTDAGGKKKKSGDKKTFDYSNIDYKALGDSNKKKVENKVDLTDEFNIRVSVMEIYFSTIGETLEEFLGGSFFSYDDKLIYFGTLQWKGAGTEFMNPKAFMGSVFTKNGGGFVNGEFFTPADFGNYFYGVAARSMGILEVNAVQGAGLYGILTGSVLDGSNWYGLFDNGIDTEMILRGYYGK
ncbi:MAG: hypothetical protein PF588_09580 [Candidatus Kapabacteria bacterium]|jgi:hypothetical protein|nr:hypothetical protein [Candidatus Kapabacteria bacterium]